jgi:hypothetical protein
MTKQLIIISAFATALSLTSCACKINVPATSVAKEAEIAAKIKADAIASIGTPELEVDFKRKINTSYAEMNDDNVALYLWLQAARCESRSNPELGEKIYKYAYDTYVAKNGAPAAAPGNFSPLTSQSQIERKTAQLLRYFQN